MPFSDQQISAAQATLSQGKLPDAVEASQHDEMTQLIIDWIRSSISKAKESEHGDSMLNLLVDIASNRIEILETIKATDTALLKAIIALKAKNGATPLSRSVKFNSAASVDWFINNGADINWGSQDDPNYNLFHVATYNNATQVPERLKAAYQGKNVEFKRAINSLDNDGYSPLAVAVLNNRPEAIAWLLANGTEINWRFPADPNFNLFHVAAGENATQALEQLKVAYQGKENEFIQAINLPNEDGYSPLAVADLNNYPEVVAWLLANGADINWRHQDDPNYNLWHLAAGKNAIQALERLKVAYQGKEDEFKQAINLLNKEGYSPLALAVLNNRAGAVAWLIANGADINWRLPAKPNFNLWHLAARENATQAFERLKVAYQGKEDEFKQAINLLIKEGYSPLAVAVYNNYPEVVAWLIANGADIHWRLLADPNFNLWH